MTTRFGATLLPCLLVLAGRAAAQDKSADTKPVEPPPARFEESVEVEGELPVLPPGVLSVTRFALPAAELPASVSVVPRTLFESQHALVLGDALRNASGVNVASGFGVFDFFVVRGFDSISSGLILVDGVPELEATFYPLYNVSQVEVLKGPSAFLHGANPLAGAVQLVKKQPRAAEFADVGLSLGRFGQGEGWIDANGAAAGGTLRGRLNTYFRRSDGYRDRSDSRLAAINPVVQWRPDERTHVNADLEYVRSDFIPDSGLPVLGDEIAPVPRSLSYQSPLDRSEQDVTRLRLVAERRVGARATLRNTLYFGKLDWLSDGSLIVGVLPDPRAVQVLRTLTQLDDRQKLVGDRLEVQVPFATGRVAHEVLAGIELSRLTDDYSLDVALLPPLALLNPVETATRETLFPLPGTSVVARSRSRTVAPFVVDRLSFSPQFQILAGARLDSVSFEERLSATDRDITKLSPLAGLVFRPSSDLTLYASAGTAFAPPSSLVIGPREPEESRQVEGGIKKSFRGGKALVTLAAFHLEKDNVAIPDATGVTRQLGDQRSRGLELELAAEMAGGVYGTLAYAFTDAELTRFATVLQLPFPPFLFFQDLSGNKAPFAPRHLASAWLEKQFANGLGLGLGARGVSAQFIAEDNAFAIEDYVTFDAMASYRRGRWKGSLNVKNLTDREYETRGFGNSSVLPASPLAIYGRVEVSLGSR